MLCLFFGEDGFRSRENLNVFLKQIPSVRGRLFSFVRFNSDNFSRSSFEELVRARNLFGENYVVICEGLLKDASTADFLEGSLKFCADSENFFVFYEETLESSHLQIFEKHAQKIDESKSLSFHETRIWLDKELQRRGIEISASLKEELMKKCGSDLWLLSSELEKCFLSSKNDLEISRKAEQVNVFCITDAISERNRSRAWLLFQKAVMAGFDAEEIFWKIVWQIKNLLLIKGLYPAPEKKIIETTRLHPFVVKKTAAACRLYTSEELSRYSQELIVLYHNSRRGLADFDVGIEKFLIKL